MPVYSENMLEHLSSCVFGKRWCLSFVEEDEAPLGKKNLTALKPCNTSSSLHFIGEGRSKYTFSFVFASVKSQ